MNEIWLFSSLSELLFYHSFQLSITINTDQLKPASKDVEMWIIAVAVSAGLFVLLLLILLLWWVSIEMYEAGL